ncbi:MAG: LptF/LptG family permease [Rhodospirillales bacterium]
MKSLDRYIMRQLLVGTTIIAAILTGVIWLIQSLKIIELMVTQGLSLSTFIGMTLLLMPNFLVFIPPMLQFDRPELRMITISRSTLSLL